MSNDSSLPNNSNGPKKALVDTSSEGVSPLSKRELRQFDGYETLEIIGIGGMGVVYKARQTALRRLVAIKTLRNYRQADERDLDRFRFEAEIVAQLQHPNIVPLYHIGEQDGQPFLAFEYVDGGSLAEKIDGVPQPPHEAAVLIETLARGVHAAHMRGIVHRDLTPKNVLIAADGTPKIADFGLAQTQQRRATSADNIAGTASYMAPEQAWGDIEGKAAGPATDVYGLGAILYELLCGRPPFKASTSQKTLMLVFHDPPPRPRSIVATIPSDLQVICLKCLEKEPLARFASAEALADDLRRFLNGEPIASRRVSRQERLWLWICRNPLFASLCFALACVVTISFAVVTERMIVAQQAKIRERRRAEELDAELYRSQFLLARNAWESSDVGRSLEILGGCNPQRRSFEWYYLSRLCKGEHAILSLQGTSVSQIDYIPGQNALAVGELSGTVRLIDASTGTLLYEFAGDDYRSAPFAFSPDGLQLACVGSTENEYCIRVWDTTSGKEVKKLGPLQGIGIAVGFLPKSGEICSLSIDQSPFSGGVGSPVVVETWNLGSGKRIRVVKGPNTDQVVRGVMVNAAISTDGNYFAWSPGQVLPPGTKHRQEIQICEIDSGQVLRTVVQPIHLLPVRFSFSRNSEYLVSFSDEGGATVWDLSSGTKAFGLEKSIGVIHAVAFSADGKVLATGGAGLVVTLYDAESGREIKRLRGHSTTVKGLTFSSDRSTLASSDAAGNLLIWPLNRPARAASIESGAIASLAFTTEQNEVVYTTLDATLHHWNPAGSSTIVSSESLTLAVSADQSHCAVVSPHGSLHIGTTSDMTRLEEVTGLPALTNNGATPITFNSKGTQLACITKERSEVLLIDVPSRQARSPLVMDGSKAVSVSYQSDGSILAVGTDANAVDLWEPSSGKFARKIRTNFPVRDVSFRPNSDDLAVLGVSKNFVQLWTIGTLEQRLQIENHLSAINCLAFTPDGRRLVTGGSDRKIRITDAESGIELLVLPDGNNEIRRLAFNREGRQLAASASLALDAGQILIWNSEDNHGRH